MRQAVGFLLEFGIGQLLVAADECDTVRHGIDGMLGEIRDVQGHGPKLERVTFRDKFLAMMQEGGPR
ncbi:hypothetical protein MCNF_01710 [Mycolicibacterium confluentis]|uniref:Uncharacterized protein n=1 Tax=Mycolicibacterium confluentis TaxID=28047 RepID=A0A7I7XQP2_9MYCO|nr:hypothetical protein MCNF_01710 [Mycolicibacterium confluentis]